MEREAVTSPDGDRVYVDRTAGDRGSEGPFYIAYATERGEDRWGFLCGNCGSLDTAMDTMGRIECNECGNMRKPEEWDAAHE
ncbi:DUF5816 domain-containing protein [Halopenitus persicus]|uniref:DUF5816 domain-containing protein n=1 Tax=Halopenitus persicus TaxID=1048396 RepID=UPI000BBAFC6C|nr:DUF5816 domain-containing protein [Halopenitus persicus]